MNQQPNVVYVQQKSAGCGTIALGVCGGLLLFASLPCLLPMLFAGVGAAGATGSALSMTQEERMRRMETPEGKRARERHEAVHGATPEPAPPAPAPTQPSAQPNVQPDPYDPNRPAPAPSDPLNPGTPSQPSAHPVAPPT